MHEDNYQPLYRRELPNGEEITVWPMTFGKGRVCLGPAGGVWFDDAYCYPSVPAAMAAALLWDGQGDAPTGWHRHPRTGRRRENGDPATEQVRW